LIEIGTEELPPKALCDLASAFEQGIRQGLEKAGFPDPAIRRFATPRRLAALIAQLPAQQPDRQSERRGSVGAAGPGARRCFRFRWPTDQGR